MFINDSVLKLGLQPDALFAFFHCQRTGGSNTLRWFNEVFGPSSVFSDRTSDDYIPWQNIDDESVLDGFKLTGGFAFYKGLGFKRPVVGISIVRHPFFRTVSLCRLAKLKTDHFAHDVAMEGTFEEFYREGSKRKPKYFHNLACQRIGNTSNAEVAIRTMESAFGIVGTTNQLSEMSAYLTNFFGWNVAPMPPGKFGPDEVHYQSRVDSPVFDEIMNNNSEDMKLYEYVKGWPATYAPTMRTTLESPAELGPVENVKSAQDYEKDDADFIAYKAKHPNASYAQYQMERIARKVKKGKSHATLGAHLVDPAGNRLDFWLAGEAKAQQYIKGGNVTTDQRVIEYGCGSLRIGAHFIKYLEPEKFYGVDVVDGFYEIGKTLIGEDLLGEKRPQFGVISGAMVENLAHFQADFIYSCAVCYHVHPDEIEFYFGALEKIANKPDAILIFEAALADAPIRYKNLSWAWPLDFIKNALKGLELLEAVKPRGSAKHGPGISLSTLKFRRPS